jgi:hypothetical protein
MGLGPRSYLVEQNLITAAANFSGMPSTLNLFGSGGDEISTWPALKISFTGATEEPDNSGNFLCEAELELFGRTDPDNTKNYFGQLVEHLKIAGIIEEWITDDLTAADLEVADANASHATYPTGFTNTLKVHNIRLVSFETDIDTAEGSLHHTWHLEIYLLQAPT